MHLTDKTENYQTKLWKGAGGRAWVETQGVVDRLFKPFEDLLVDSVRRASTRRSLDVGCGTGSTTLAVARLLSQSGSCTGIDISDPMIEAARSRAERESVLTQFICADAETHAFAPASFDMIISRFGVMFFNDPVRAFANLRSAAAKNAQLQFIAWRSADENPFMTTAERAAAPLLPNLPPRRPDAPGQFGFSDRTRVHKILADSGWSDINIKPIDIECTMPEKELNEYLTRLGPVGLALQDADEQIRTQVIEVVRSAFDPYVHGAEVRFTAACWMVSARVPPA